MIAYIRNWFERNFSDPRTIAFTVVLMAGAVAAVILARLLPPVLASIVIAYLLEGLVARLTDRKMARFPAVLAVYALYLAVFVVTLVGLLPLLTQQVGDLVRDLPEIVALGQGQLRRLPDLYPQLFSPDQIQTWIQSLGREVARWGQQLLQSSIGFIPGVITVLVYLVLMPLLIFFFLKDKATILGWLGQFLPRERSMATEVWAEVDVQLGNYVRGKFLEIVIVGTATYATFTALGLNYAFLLSVLVGLSVLIPYIGATVVTFPIAVIAFYQWGWSGELAWILIAYAIIQALDANVVVPILFSEVVNLHPVAIIIAVLFFGGIWGFWGIFFAIPLATVVKAVLSAWPRQAGDTAPPGEPPEVPPSGPPAAEESVTDAPA